MKLLIEKNVKKYDALYKSGHDHSYPNLDLVRIVSSFIKPKNNNILDYGFGSGENIIHMSRLNFKKIYGIETSIEAIKLLKKKIKKNKKKQIIISKLESNHTVLPYQNKFFDNIICTSVLSLLGSKENIVYLVSEFHRILKPGGKLIVDINGPESLFKSKGKFINDDTYQSYIKNKKQKIYTYCPKNIKVFRKLFKKFKIDNIGEIKFKYFNFLGHEFIACLKKK